MTASTHPQTIQDVRIFSGSANRPLAEAVARHLNTQLSPLTITYLSDGEIHVQINELVRHQDVFLIQPCSMPVNDHFVELLLLIDAFRRASAGRITAVIPYFAYGRSDKKDQPRVPITARLLANLIETAGADRVLTMDLHASQIQGFFKTIEGLHQHHVASCLGAMVGRQPHRALWVQTLPE